MRVDVLLNDEEAVVALSRALRSPGNPRLGVEVEHLFSWESVTQRLKDGAADLAIVQIDFPPDDPARSSNLRSLEVLETVVPPGGVIPYLGPPGGSESLDRMIRHLWFPLLIVRGVDDDPPSVLRILARAWGLREIRTRFESKDTLQPDPDLNALVDALLGWPPVRSVSDLAEELNISPRTLFRHLAAAGRCPPRELICKAAAIEVGTLCSFGFRSLHHLAVLLGYRDPRTLLRLYEGCTGIPLDQRLRTAREGQSEAVSAFLSDLTA